jgi:RNA polymerase sigma-70 factor (ECF subfamily)
MTDSQLITSVGQHDQSAFNELWRRYEGRVHNYFYRLLNDKHLVEDCYQQLFMALWQGACTYRGGNPSAYLTGVARNIYLKAVASKFSKEVPVSCLRESQLNQIPLEPPNWYSCLLREELKQKVQNFKANLSERQRQIFALRAESELSWKEISSKTGMSEASCTNTYYRLRDKLAARLRW